MLRARSVTLPHQGTTLAEQASEELRGAARNAARTSPFVDGWDVVYVAMTAGGARQYPHKLGRKPRMIVACVPESIGAGVTWSAVATSTMVTVTTTGAVTVALMVT